MSDPVQIIGAVATGVVAIIAAYGAIQVRRTRTNVAEVHTMVNSRSEKMEARIEQLADELRTRGDGTVPPVPPPPPEEGPVVTGPSPTT